MANAASAPRLRRHSFALVCSTAFLTIMPTGLYIVLIAWSNDLGGPLNLIIIPTASAIIGLVISLVAFVPIGLLAESSSFQRWQQIVGGLFVAMTALVVLGLVFVQPIKPQNRGFLAAGGFSLYFVGGLFVYLCGLAVCRRIWPPISPSNP